MNAGRFVGEGVRHQGDDGSDAFVPTQRVIKFDQADMQAASLDKIAPAKRILERGRLPPKISALTQCEPSEPGCLGGIGGSYRGLSLRQSWGNVEVCFWHRPLVRSPFRHIERNSMTQTPVHGARCGTHAACGFQEHVGLAHTRDRVRRASRDDDRKDRQGWNRRAPLLPCLRVGAHLLEDLVEDGELLGREIALAIDAVAALPHGQSHQLAGQRRSRSALAIMVAAEHSAQLGKAVGGA